MSNNTPKTPSQTAGSSSATVTATTPTTEPAVVKSDNSPTPSPARNTEPTLVVAQTAPEAAADATRKRQQEAEDAAPAKAKLAADRGDLAVAVSLIVQTGKDGKPEDVPAGTVFRPVADDVDFLQREGAIREPTEQEVQIFEHLESIKRKAADSAADADDTLG